MNEITTVLTTKATFSDDGRKRYLLTKVWDEQKPKLAIIMLAPSSAAGIELDTTTQLVLNNADRLGYGSVAIVNLFATLNDFSLKHAEDEDPENLDTIAKAAQEADTIVYASGVGKAKNKTFLHRQTQVLLALHIHEKKLVCLSNADGKARLQHPLSPAVRTWHLSPLKIKELLPDPPKATPTQEKQSSEAPTKKEKTKQ